MQWNANGIGNKKAELREFMRERGVHVALLQESKLRAGSRTPSFPGYTTLRVDRPGGAGGGGLLAIISREIPFTNSTPLTLASLPVDVTREVQTITLRVTGEDISLTNVYIPPTASCPPGYSIDLPRLSASSRRLVVGDFNAHSPTWYYDQAGDPRGALLQDQLEEMISLNDPLLPTRIPFDLGTRPTSPDVSFASGDLALRAKWTVSADLGSDHCPILVDLQLSKPLPNKSPRTFVNYKKAGWEAFTTAVETSLSAFDPAAYQSIDEAVGV